MNMAPAGLEMHTCACGEKRLLSSRFAPSLPDEFVDDFPSDVCNADG